MFFFLGLERDSEPEAALALSGNRFSEKIMLKQEHEMMIRSNRIIIWLSTHYSRRDCAATTATSRKSMI